MMADGESSATSGLKTVIDFLSDRGYPEEQIKRIQSDRIDVTAVQNMSDQELSRYVPAFGDRINLRSRCKAKNTGKKEALFDKLRKKMKMKTNDEEKETRPTRSLNLRGNKNALKINRKIELGWIHDGKHVRSANGGGSRKVELQREAKKADILKETKDIFFPKGISKKGVLLSSVLCKVLDFAQTEFDDNISISEMYDTVKMGMLRFHLYTSTEKSKYEYKDEKPHLESAETVSIINSFCQESKEMNIAENTENVSLDSFNDECYETDVEVLVKKVVPSPKEQGNIPKVPSLVEFLPKCSSSDDEILPKGLITTPAEEVLPRHASPPPKEEVLRRYASPLPEQEVLLQHTSLLPEQEVMSNCSSPLPEEEVLLQHSFLLPEEELLPRSPSPPPELTSVRVHRVKIMEELIEKFKNPQIIVMPLQFSFINEAGADQSGVSRDVYSSFWSEFFSRAAEGEDSRIPALNPQWQREEWKSVGRILVKGLLDHNIFPLSFAPAFISALIFGEHSVSEETYFNSFLTYLNKSERDLAKAAMEGNLSPEDQEDFLDMIDRFGCKKIPTTEEMRKELVKMAHKEFIQKPKYALEKMGEVCRAELVSQIPSEADLLLMYEAKKPTVRRLLRMIRSTPTTPAENQCLQFFKQYIRAQESLKSIEKLLRFLTGTEVLCVDKIEVTFTKLVGMGRRPIAHTCGPTLELPCTYTSYIELRYEMDNILNSGDHCMEMNIV